MRADFVRDDRGVASVIVTIILTLVVTIMTATIGNIVVHIAADTMPSEETMAYVLVGDKVVEIANPTMTGVPLAPLEILVNSEKIEITDENGNEIWDPGEKIRVDLSGVGSYAIVEVYYDENLVYKGAFFSPIPIYSDTNYPYIAINDLGNGQNSVDVSDDTAIIVTNVYYGNETGEYFLGSYTPHSVQDALNCYKEYEKTRNWNCPHLSSMEIAMKVTANSTDPKIKKVNFSSTGGSTYTVETSVYYVRFETFDVTGKPTSVVETVDAPPFVEITLPADGSQFVTSTGVVSVNVRANAKDDYGLAKLTLFVNGTQVTETSCGGSDSCSMDTQISVSEGQHVIRVVAEDTGGHTGEDSVTINVVRNAPPQISFLEPANGTEFYTSVVGIRIEAYDSDSPLSKIELYVDGVLEKTWSENSQNAQETYTLSLPTGTHTLRAKAYDVHSANATAEVTIEVKATAAPFVVITSPSTDYVLLPPGESTTNVLVSAEISDDRGLSTCILFIDGNPVDSRTISGTSYDYSHLVSLSKGSHTITIQATDVDNLTGSATKSITVAETQPPTVQIVRPYNGEIFPLSNPQIPVEVQASDDNGVTRVELYFDGNLVESFGSAPYTTTLTITTAGDHVIRAVAYDTEGLSSEDSVNIVVVDEDLPPKVTINSPHNGEYFVGNPNYTVSISATAIDDVGLDRMELYLDGSAVASCQLSGTLDTCTTTRTLSPGTYTFMAVAYDNKGQSSNSAVTFRVVDGNDVDIQIVAVSVPEVSWSSTVFTVTN